jgi:hypothetical protein
MVMRDRPQALFQPRMHPKRTAVEIVSALEAGLKKSGEKSGLDPVSSPRHITRSVRISRTTRSCTLHGKGYVTYRGRAAALEGC